MTTATGVAKPPPLTTYETQTQASAGAPWNAGLSFGLGFSWDASLSIPEPIVQIGGQDLSDYVALAVDANGCLTVTLNATAVQTVLCAGTPNSYVRMAITMSADGTSFAGSISQLCSGPVSYSWRGSCEAAGAPWLVNMWSWTVAGRGQT